MATKNHLYYGDNLAVLRQSVADESVDLVYADPPFNSAQNYNVIFRRDGQTTDSSAQVQAFSDTWKWTPETEAQYTEYVSGALPTRVGDALRAMHTLLGENDALAYLVSMAPRLVEMHRVLKPTGSMYIHCDPTMSHYLKVLLDATFDARCFRNEIIWKRTPFKGSSKSRAQQLPRSHDVILFYTKGDTWTWNAPTVGYTDKYLSRFKQDDNDGRGPYRSTSLKTYSTETFERLQEDDRLIPPSSPGAGWNYKQYLSESPGFTQVDDIWDDINALNPMAKERLGYPTQKPVALLERIIAASSNEGDVVLDPFCGCGTTVDAAQKLGRRWLGIDVTYTAIDLIVKRLVDTHGQSVRDTFTVSGIPSDKAAALALFTRSPLEFERWAVALVGAQPNKKQVGDRGIDGVGRFPIDGVAKTSAVGTVLVSVKGGRQLNPSMVRDLAGTIATEKAELGVLVVNGAPTRGMLDAAAHAGSWVHPATQQRYEVLQIITTGDLLLGRRPNLPPLYLWNKTAPRAQGGHGQDGLFE